MTGLPYGHHFLPGPVDVHPEVRDAMLGPTIGHRGPEMAALLESMAAPLRSLFGSVRPVMIATSSATGFMEASVRSGVRDRLLAVVSGYFGERYAQVAEACGKQVVRAVVPPGECLTPDHLDRFLQGPPVDAVSIVHSETSTGALAPLAELAAVVRRRDDIVTLVDAVSSVGATPIESDLWHLDFVFTASQKALALPPGLALAVASPRMMERARSAWPRGWYFDLVRFDQAAREHFPTQTPAIPLYFALAAQLRRIEAAGGLEARFARHAALAQRMAEWCERHGLPLAAREGYRSPSVSAIRLPDRITPARFLREVAARGYRIAPGLRPLDAHHVRVGHMGDVTMAQLDALLGVLDQALGEL